MSVWYSKSASPRELKESGRQKYELGRTDKLTGIARRDLPDHLPCHWTDKKATRSELTQAGTCSTRPSMWTSGVGPWGGPLAPGCITPLVALHRCLYMCLFIVELQLICGAHVIGGQLHRHKAYQNLLNIEVAPCLWCHCLEVRDAASMARMPGFKSWLCGNEQVTYPLWASVVLYKVKITWMPTLRSI